MSWPGRGLWRSNSWSRCPPSLRWRPLCREADSSGGSPRRLRADRPVELEEEKTLAGALAGGIGLDNQVTFRLIRDLVSRHRIVYEPDIRAAMAYAYREVGVVLEGGGAVALAAALEGHLDAASGQDGTLVVVLSGGNVATNVLQSAFVA